MKASRHIAVLGAGIMGCSVALYLARKGIAVTLFDEAAEPFTGASRWNEGKIHLGYIYSADSSLHSARHVLSGGLLFKPLVEDLLATSLEPVITAQDDIYLCHRDSVVAADDMAHYLDRVSELVRAHPDAHHYLTDVSGATSHRLSAAELAANSDSREIVAGFHVPERSVETTWIGNRFQAAVAAEPLIHLRMGERVLAAHPAGESVHGPWTVATNASHTETYSHVVNALWQGRMVIDASAGIRPRGVWSNRYRQSVFLRTRRTVHTPCAIIATGPFGDIKNYNGRDFYLSWYPAGLRIDSSAVEPPPLHTLNLPDPALLTGTVLDTLQSLLPWVGDIRAEMESSRVEGGWVFAAGRGELSDPAASLHKRSDYGVTRSGNYLSIDTGKYATAPWTAHNLVQALCGETTTNHC